MGTINLTSKSQRIAIKDQNGYIARPDRYSKIKADSVIEYAAQSAGVPAASVRACCLAMRESVAYYVCNGHSVNLGKFGKFRPTIKATSAVSKKLCNSKLVKSIKVLYRPSKALQELVNAVHLTNTVK